METPNLYPLSIGEILDRAFRLYRRHFGLLIGITLAAYVPMIALEVGSFLLFKTTRYVDWIDGLVISTLVSGALTTAISDIYLGQIATTQDAFRNGWRRFKSVLGSTFLMALGAFAPLIAFSCFFSTVPIGGGEGLFLVLLIILQLPLATFLLTRWNLAVPAIVIEEFKASEGLSRSWYLTDGYFGRVFGTSFLVFLLFFILARLPQIAFLYGFEFIAPGSEFGPLIETVLSHIGTIIANPFSAGVPVILFYDLLVRKEGFDLKFQLENDFSETKEENTI